jgi:hypothetical protein
MPEPELFLLFIRPLNNLNLPYMVTGATAAIVYGIPRLTNDIDLILNLQISEISKFCGAFKKDMFYIPPEEVIITEISREYNGHINLLHIETGYKADCYFKGRDSLHDWAWKNRKSLEFHGEKIWFAPPEYVILRKLQYYREGGSEKHLNDIRNMIQISGENINFKILKEKINQNKLADEWKLVAKESS